MFTPSHLGTGISWEDLIGKTLILNDFSSMFKTLHWEPRKTKIWSLSRSPTNLWSSVPMNLFSIVSTTLNFKISGMVERFWKWYFVAKNAVFFLYSVLSSLKIIKSRNARISKTSKNSSSDISRNGYASFVNFSAASIGTFPTCMDNPTKWWARTSKDPWCIFCSSIDPSLIRSIIAWISNSSSAFSVMINPLAESPRSCLLLPILCMNFETCRGDP